MVTFLELVEVTLTKGEHATYFIRGIFACITSVATSCTYNNIKSKQIIFFLVQDKRSGYCLGPHHLQNEFGSVSGAVNCAMVTVNFLSLIHI